MRKAFILLLAGCLLSCRNQELITPQLQNEVLSQNVYATRDSIEASRYDLAATYATEITRIIDPPKKRIIVKAIQDPKTKKAYIVVPKELEGKEILVVDSAQYINLLDTKEIADQIFEENQNLKFQIQKTDKEIQRQTQFRLKLIKNYNESLLTIKEKDGKINELEKFIGYLVIGLIAIVAGIVGYIFLKIKGLLPSFLLF